MRLRRGAGVLLHPTSLPGPGIGSLGPAAYRFVDWLAAAGQSHWQVLPLVAVGQAGSPYNGLSAMAGNVQLISEEQLVREGLLEEADQPAAPAGQAEVDFWAAATWKEELLGRAYDRFCAGAARELKEPFDAYVAQHAHWLDDFALFRVLRGHSGNAAWTDWAPGLRDRETAELERFRREHAAELERQMFQQFLFDRQWSALRQYANDRGVRIIGDIPIFVAHDSADVWANRELFQLDEAGDPVVVSGVPPDYFSETGQRWGNPLYRWDVMLERGYSWWVRRFRRTLEWVDLLRVDHFRGFEAYWEIPASEETAMEGEWRPGPGESLFRAVESQVGEVPIIAEDLGLITEEVEALRDALGFPGMRVLQFGFDGNAENPHLPENYPRRAVAYTGTHDNDTILGWWRSASAAEKRRVRQRISGVGGNLHWELMELVFESEADLAVVPLQDLLGLDSEARMNTPGTAESNWSWRFTEEQLTQEIRDRLLDLTRRADRLRSDGNHPQKAGAP